MGSDGWHIRSSYEQQQLYKQHSIVNYIRLQRLRWPGQKMGQTLGIRRKENQQSSN